MVCLIVVFCAATAIASPAQTFNSLISFDGTDGFNPYYMSLIQGADGNIYGTTASGGVNGYGTLFKMTPGGKLYTPVSLNGTDGAYPYSGGVQAADGYFYGTTTGGGTSTACGTYGCGTIFKVSAGGTLSTFYNFCSLADCADGYLPVGGLVQATNGNFYGTTATDGVNGYGTVFRITPAGKLSTLHSFAGTDGSYPLGNLVQGANGNFYGTTNYGGVNGLGTVFEMTAAGSLTWVYSFDGTHGSYPNWLVLASNGNFYGTTSNGGANNTCTGGCGTVFKITAGGKLTTLYSFCAQTNCADGASPSSGLVQATNGNFYGTTWSGANTACTNGCGTVFEITAAGALTTLYSFGGGADGRRGNGLVQATNGTLYGTTYTGGDLTCNAPYGCGTVFSLSVGLGPFVETLPTSGKVGAAVIILGNKLTGSTAVSFNGTAATFTVISNTEIKTTVPTGATTGTVEVTTPTKTLKSNVAFRVTPQLTSFTPPSGPVGTSVTITGVSLTQTTEVTFGGVKATSFTVVNDTTVTATVPTGAVTGKIKITTKGGTATSATSFTVTT
jgi:uncharacterized repeat protein (TIGR03803 family)